MKFGNPRFDSERLQIRMIQNSDIEELYEIYADPEVMKYWSHLPFTKRDQAKEMIADAEKAVKEGSSLRLAIIYKPEEKLIGTLSLFNFNESSRRAEVGYILSNRYWRKGLTTEALNVLITYSFHELNLNRLEADIDPDNIASAMLLQKCGFEHEGRLKERWIVNDIPSDSDIYGLLQSSKI